MRGAVICFIQHSSCDLYTPFRMRFRATNPEGTPDHLWVLGHVQQGHGVICACQCPVAAGRMRLEVSMDLSSKGLVGEHRGSHDGPVQSAHFDHALGPGKIGVGLTENQPSQRDRKPGTRCHNGTTACYDQTEHPTLV